MTQRLDGTRRPLVRRGVWKLTAWLVAANVVVYGSLLVLMETAR